MKNLIKISVRMDQHHPKNLKFKSKFGLKSKRKPNTTAILTYELQQHEAVGTISPSFKIIMSTRNKIIRKNISFKTESQNKFKSCFISLQFRNNTIF